MDEEKLSYHSINLLYEIIIHKQSAESDQSFWYNRMTSLSQENAQRLCNALRELTSAGYIQVLWADRNPAEVYVQPAGYDFFRRKMRPIMREGRRSGRELTIALSCLAAGAILGQLPWLWSIIFG